MLRSVVVGLCLMLPVFGHAEEEGRKSKVGLGAALRSGNTEKSLYTVNATHERYSRENDWISSFYGEYGTTESVQTEGLARAKSEYRARFQDKLFFGSLFGSGLHDSIRRIQLRVKLGPNIGYYFTNTPKMKLDATVGLNATHERTTADMSTYGAYRLAARFNWDFSDRSSTYASVELNSNLEDATNDYNSLFIAGLKSGLAGALSLYLELRDDFDNMPDVAGSKKNDLLVTVGLACDF